MTAELADIKADLEALKEDEHATMSDVNELLERAEAIKEIMDNNANGDACSRCGEVHENFIAKIFCMIKYFFIRLFTLVGILVM